MPPRIHIISSLRASKPSLPTAQSILPFRAFTTTTPLLSSRRSAPKSRQTHDPYILAQKARKKAANLSRRASLEAARVSSLGDPIRGTSTPFVESFATGVPPPPPQQRQQEPDNSTANATANLSSDVAAQHLNYALTPDAVQAQLLKSQELAVPLDEVQPQGKPAARGEYGIDYSRNGGRNEGVAEPVAPTPEEIEAKRRKDHERAAEAIARITALENGSSKDRMRVNIARCVETFGRHNTDRIFPPRAPPLPSLQPGATHPVRPETNVSEASKRIGPDTGSSEVQIAILTAKIKTLADFLETRGKGDKHNKRNLRLLVHKRQKLLKYLRRKERGGPRWQHCIETLGLTEGTWKGEISL